MSRQVVRPEITRDANHVYFCEGRKLPSVTTIINATVPKGGLDWWGMKVGVTGCYELRRRGALPATPEEAIKALTAHKLTVNHTLKAAGDRGTAIHKALEDYGHGKIPRPLDFPKEYRPRIHALARWLSQAEPEFLDMEVMTCSLIHGYAGTFDLRAKVNGKVGLIDLKTSKGVYPESHFPQLEAYEQAEVELGEEPTEFRAVLHLPEKGEAKLVESTYDFADFAVLLRAYQRKQERKNA